MISFELVTNKNICDALKLTVGIHQKNMIETVQECLDEAIKYDCWKPTLIKYNNEIIGFCMYGLWDYPPEPKRVWIDRFFIDINHQNKGYSKSVLKELINMLKDDYDENEMYLSVYETNEIAINIYKSLEFSFNGELDINGEKVMVKKLTSNT